MSTDQKEISGTVWLEGDVVMCSCPDCQAPISVRSWLMTAECWQCGITVELTDEQEREVRRLQEEQRQHPESPAHDPTEASPPIKRVEDESDEEDVKSIPVTDFEQIERRPPKRRPPQAPSRIIEPPPVEAPPVAAGAETEALVQVDDAPGRHGWFHSLSAAFAAALFHLVLLVVLALWIIPNVLDDERDMQLINTVVPARDDLDTFLLEEELTPATHITVHGLDRSFSLQGGSGAQIADARLDPSLLAKVESTKTIKIEGPASEMPKMDYLITETPDGLLGDPRAIIDNYDQAMDRITQEILWRMEKSNVLVTWVFDQSESMKDDQREIRERIYRVYAELGLQRRASGDRLTTSVTSYGEGFLLHTKQPTHDINIIREAIDAVPVDPSGKEMMCAAVTTAIAAHAEYAKREDRQMMLIVVTDETGEKPDNLKYLEQAIAMAKLARCHVYILGREAVFGYPYAHMKWVHPQTKHVHWLPVDRGPETAFVEQLQTEGFGRRYDAHPSGFGPYGQTRMARETGGIFFMLPSLESDVVRGEKRRYELEAMREYKPDLRHRPQLIAERNASILRSVLWKVINDLNPYEKEVAKFMKVRTSFDAAPAKFGPQVRAELVNTKTYVSYLDTARQALDQIREYRDYDTSPRWQANYDLIYAQLLAYTARVYEYGAYLDRFLEHPKPVPVIKPGFLRLHRWSVHLNQETISSEVAQAFLDRSREMFDRVIIDHPGTPWAARAEWELSRKHGVNLKEHYIYFGPKPPKPPSRPSPPRPRPPSVPSIPVPRIPIPKL